MAQRIKLGIIGCSEVTQINHFPSLKFLSDLFEVVAVSDASAKVLGKVGNLYHIKERFVDYRDLVKHSNVAAVLITTPHVYHVEQTLAALEHGKHVLVEKPMAAKSFIQILKIILRRSGKPFIIMSLRATSPEDYRQDLEPFGLIMANLRGVA